MSDTPETREAAERWRQGKINIFDEMARMERERNNLQDQRDFAMGEIERLKKEAAHKDKLLREMRAAIRMVADDSCKGWLL